MFVKRPLDPVVDLRLVEAPFRIALPVKLNRRLRIGAPSQETGEGLAHRRTDDPAEVLILRNDNAEFRQGVSIAPDDPYRWIDQRSV